MHSPEQIANFITQAFQHTLLPCQERAIVALSRFLTTDKTDVAFILKGYAGTGKTSIIASLVRVLRRLHRPVVLLAPTGRAAKVFSHHAGTTAYTIHKVIYRQQTFNGEDTKFSLGFNKLKDALFIVDEASMLANSEHFSSIFGAGMLLDDLVHFVYGSQGCRLLLVGDTAQLPPVGADESPALQRDFLAGYGLLVGSVSLTEVIRQSKTSGVLFNATRLRDMIVSSPSSLPIITGSEHGEVHFINGNEILEELEDAYNQFGEEETIIITRSNKRANLYNNEIRNRIFEREEELEQGDRIMVVKNNYFWVEQIRQNFPPEEVLPMDFIANGDTAEILNIHNIHKQHGFLFADATLLFTDYHNVELDCRILLSTLQSESPSLTSDESLQLYEKVLADYAHIPSKKERMKQIREDPYYNALQIKYAYAITCHKAQGGQWKRVFIDQGFVSEGTIDTSYLRWLYTAFTRTTDRLYLINWPISQKHEV